MKIKPGTRVLVCDGSRYVIYENKGDIDRLDLRVVGNGSNENPPAREHGDDRPGRFPSPDGQRSAVGQTNQHDQTERQFIEELAVNIGKWSLDDSAHQFLLIADPRSLGVMRAKLAGAVQDRIIASIIGDYTHHPVQFIEDLVEKA